MCRKLTFLWRKQKIPRMTIFLHSILLCFPNKRLTLRSEEIRILIFFFEIV